MWRRWRGEWGWLRRGRLSGVDPDPWRWAISSQPGRLATHSLRIIATVAIRCTAAAAKFAAVAASVVLSASPAFAGVILEQPQLKKVGICVRCQSVPTRELVDGGAPTKAPLQGTRSGSGCETL